VQPGPTWPSPRQLIELDRDGQTLDGHRPQRRNGDESLCEPKDIRREQRGIGLGQLLRARGQMGRLADRRVVHPQVAADGADHHLARVQADSGLDHGTVIPPDLFRIATNGRLHVEGRIATADGVILVGQGRAEEGHDPVAHDLVHRALVAVDRLHHSLEHGVEELPSFLGVSVCQQLHGSLQVGEEDRDLLPLALEGSLRGEDLLGEVLGGVAGRTQGAIGNAPQQRGPTGAAKLLPRANLGAALRAGEHEASAALLAEARVVGILRLALGTRHVRGGSPPT
jgi:hypothetical protein